MMKLIYKSKYIIKIFLILLCSVSFFCRSTPESRGFDSRNTLTGNSIELSLSGGSIDRGKTYELFFLAKGQEECVKISINSVITDEITQNEASAGTYFIVEKAVDVSRFRGVKKEQMYIELARNFDINWARTRDLLICIPETDPIKKLDTGIYRIRFTVFNDSPFKFDINIFSDNRIEIFKSYPKNG